MTSQARLTEGFEGKRSSLHLAHPAAADEAARLQLPARHVWKGESTALYLKTLLQEGLELDGLVNPSFQVSGSLKSSSLPTTVSGKRARNKPHVEPRHAKVPRRAAGPQTLDQALLRFDSISWQAGQRKAQTGNFGQQMPWRRLRGIMLLAIPASQTLT